MKKNVLFPQLAPRAARFMLPALLGVMAASATVADDKAQVAGGFREGGSTFGLNMGVVEIEGKKDASEAERLAAFEKSKADVLAQVPRDKAESNQYAKAVNALVAFREKRAEWRALDALCAELSGKIKGRYPNLENAMLAKRVNALYRAGDRKGFDELVRQVAAMPVDGAAVSLVADASVLLSRPPAADAATRALLWKGLVDGRARLEPADRQRVLEAMFGLADDAKSKRALWEEAVKGAEDPSRVRLAGAWRRHLQETHAWGELLPFAKADAAVARPHFKAGYELARIAYLAGDRETCLAAIATCTNAQLKAGEKFNMEVLKTLLREARPRPFAANVAKLRGDADEKTYFNFLRGACKFLYELDSGVEMSARIRELVRLSFELEWPEERLWYTATYVEEAPMTAEAAFREGLFDRLKVENRLGQYNFWDWMGGTWQGYDNRNKDYPRLKSAEKPHLEADKPGKEAVVAVCYDARGVNLYAKFNDPDAWKSKAGFADGLYFECSVQPGDESSWHWLLISALKPSCELDIDWDSPQFGRKRTADYLKSDVYVGDDCYVVHVHAPWLLAYDRLPTGRNDLWRFVVVGGWAGEFGALGGGGVHELGRGLHVKFDMPGKAADAVRLGVLRAAAGEYLAFRKKWESADFWADRDLGDPDFFDKVVKPYLAELDAAAAEATAPELDAAKVRRLSGYLRDFSDTRLSLDAKRAAYLKAKFWAE